MYCDERIAVEKKGDKGWKKERKRTARARWNNISISLYYARAQKLSLTPFVAVLPRHNYSSLRPATFSPQTFLPRLDGGFIIACCFRRTRGEVGWFAHTLSSSLFLLLLLLRPFATFLSLLHHSTAEALSRLTTARRKISSATHF